MIIFLLKATLIWSLFLLLYQLFYRKSPAFTMNRMYLFIALAAGLLLPFITWNTLWTTSDVTGVSMINTNLQNLEAAVRPEAQNISGTTESVSVYTLLTWIYLGGAIFAALFVIREVVIILRTAIYGQFKVINGHRIFCSTKDHAPFSFMGWIFITRPELYTGEELNYILRHEDAHNRRRHWLDIILMQLVFIVFWFHPLIWYFRYLLKLTHEYEADQVAANNNAYEYGHFLLGQTLLKGSPSIAHSFHFSPIKNRITMLTNTKKKNSWKYIFAIPVLLTCTLVFAKSNLMGQRVRQGDITTYNGHHFYWEKNRIDSTQVMDLETKETTWIVTQKEGTIYRMDNDSVFSNYDPMITQAQFRYNKQQFQEYVESKFKSIHPTIPDSIVSIDLENIVIDEGGKISYYDMKGYTSKNTYDLSAIRSPLLYGKTLEKIMDKCPDFLPAFYKGKNVRVFFGALNVYVKKASSER